ncbi:hypothetical protein Pmani_037934 [Petrolisthes manimaculis]|uniref:Methyltransferase FkbM domain-containing protein n=1 Tax=Petrolisthes manimaculis TaxID=1843537 RepID=A0AAE1TKY9_9EUCA|nr:hypothetical protein Pmani_037934 [Petrolisthes manimaculis]
MSVDKANVNRWVSVSLLTLLSVFALLLLLQFAATLFGPSKSACTKQVCLTRFLEGPPAFNNEVVAAYMRDNYFLPQAASEYRLSGHDGASPTFNAMVEYIREYFKNKRGGVFVDLGAGDGEYRSLTLHLEKSLGWSGLLVEPNPKLYKRLLKKGRKAQLTKACVSPFSYPAKMDLSYPVLSEAVGEEEEIKQLGLAKLEQLWPKETDTKRQKEGVQCIPLENLVYAAGLNKPIDIFVLDMSGSDLDVLLNTKLDQIPDIQMIVIHSNGANMNNEIGGYFLERNMVIKKVFGSNAEAATYILVKFDARRDL